MYIANRLTENELGFSLYLTDVTYDNIAVNRDGKIVIIDLEDILIVDKAKIRRGLLTVVVYFMLKTLLIMMSATSNTKDRSSKVCALTRKLALLLTKHFS